MPLRPRLASRRPLSGGAFIFAARRHRRRKDVGLSSAGADLLVFFLRAINTRRFSCDACRQWPHTRLPAGECGQRRRINLCRADRRGRAPRPPRERTRTTPAEVEAARLEQATSLDTWLCGLRLSTGSTAPARYRAAIGDCRTAGVAAPLSH